MEEKFISRQTVNFLLFEMLEIQKLSQHEYFNEYNKEALDMVLGTANKIAVDVMRPYLREMDKNPPVYKNGNVAVHPIVKTFLRKCGAIGFISAHFPFEDGGQQLPYSIVAAFNYIFAAANYSLGVYPGLTSGAANLIITFGSPDLKKYYTPKMYSGEWQGTMALTEPEAGSSLSDIKTKAIPTGEGFYLMKGQKIFISAGTHDGVDNVVNLMLARVEGAPAGVKGISLFVVPKLRGDGQGGLVSNDVTCAGIEHKLGYRGSPITQLSMGENGDCRGWLVGEENRGLAYMFQMMNEERINVGIGAAGIASAAYYDSLKYAGERAQGRPLNSKNPSEPQCAIISHPDVKRMLLLQKAISEGSLSLALQVGKYIDLKHVSSAEEIEKYDLLLEFLTPIAKSYPSENGILSASTGLQILGGYGYCEDFNLELFFRDSRIHPIHEGTTGIQGQDLLGRKTTMKKGRALELFVDEIKSTISEAEKYTELKNYAAKLNRSISDFQKTAAYLLGVAAKGNMEIFLADATLYLEMAGIITIAWQWLMQAACAVKQTNGCEDDTLGKFYSSKIHTMKFFFKYELPKAETISGILLDEEILTVGVDEGLFVD
jgi:butyryl-CoA dehydrogenase